MSIYQADVKTSVNNSFQEALLASLMEESDQEEDLCLITGEAFEEYPKQERYMLPCGHAFLRKAIYQEVRKQKYDWKVNRHTSNHTVCFYKQFCIYQFMCPYCRKIHNKLLPQWDGFQVLRGVNSPLKYTLMKNRCQYILSSGKRKGNVCGVSCNDEYCKRHTKKEHTDQCMSHTQQVQHTQQNIHNVVESVHIQSGQPQPPHPQHYTQVSIPSGIGTKHPKHTKNHTCSAILKSGKRKGQVCGVRCTNLLMINNQDHWVCGRHMK